MIEQDVRDVAIADANVSALISTRFYLGHLDSDITFPLTQMRATGGTLGIHLAGEGGNQHRTFQFDCYSLQESDASALAKTIRDALTGTKANFTGIGIDAPQVFYEDEHHVHRASFEMSFWF